MGWAETWRALLCDDHHFDVVGAFDCKMAIGERVYGLEVTCTSDHGRQGH